MNKFTSIIGHTDFVINIAMHVLILFSFLSIFFSFYITKISKDAFNAHISEMLEKSLGPSIATLKQSPQMNQLLNIIPYDKLRQLYGSSNKLIDQQNNNLFNQILMINIFLWTGFIMMILTLTFTCNKDLPITKILIENLLTFTFIGIIEYLFFTTIIMKYIPILPSFMYQEFLTKLKTMF